MSLHVNRLELHFDLNAGRRYYNIYDFKKEYALILLRYSLFYVLYLLGSYNLQYKIL